MSERREAARPGPGALVSALRQLLGGFNAARRAQAWSSNTLALHDRALRRFIAWIGTERSEVPAVTAIDRRLVEDYALHLATAEDERGLTLKAASRLAYLSALRVFFDWLEGEGKILRSPARDLKLPKVAKPVPRGVLTQEEVRRALRVPDLDTPSGLRDRAILELFYGSAVRRNELLALELQDLDLAEGMVTVREGKGGKGRVVPMGKAAARSVKRYLEQARPGLLRAGDDERAVFLSRVHRPLSPDRLGVLLKAIGLAAGLDKPLTPHGLRHTCATHLLQGDADVRHVQEQLGHKSLLSTQRYTHLAAADLKRVHERCHPRERGR